MVSPFACGTGANKDDGRLWNHSLNEHLLLISLSKGTCGVEKGREGEEGGRERREGGRKMERRKREGENREEGGSRYKDQTLYPTSPTTPTNRINRVEERVCSLQ